MSLVKLAVATIVGVSALVVTSNANASCIESARYKAEKVVTSGAGQTQVIEKIAGKKYLVTTNVGTRLKKTFLVRFYGGSCHPSDAKIWQVEARGVDLD